MTFAFWCLLPAMGMPFIWATLAKTGPGFDNAAPRDYFANLEGWRRRANWAQQNALEAFPRFATAVIVAHLLSADQPTVDMLAGAYVGARFLHGVCYLADLALMRSLVFTIGMVCILSLFLAGA